MKRFFITGTDTDAGKTYVTCLLAEAIAKQNKNVMCLKPVAAGAELEDGIWKNEDAKKLIASANVILSYQQTNPFCFKQAIAPHIAAVINQHTVTLNDMQRWFNQLPQTADYCLIEGAGGFLVPLNELESFADIPSRLNCDVILVVGMKLGCINHALLTVESINAKGYRLAGWIANQVDPNMSVYQENIITLKKAISAPMLAEVKYNDNELQLIDLV